MLGDTQCVVEDHPDYFINTNRWLAEQAETLRLSYVLPMGDMVDDVEEIQFENARAAMDILDEAEIPYSLVLGNHDYLGYANSDRNFQMYDRYFPLSSVQGKPGFGGSMDGSTVENTYHLFSAGGEDYLILAIAFKPLNTTLDWVCEVVEAHPDRKVIVTTHSYLNEDGTINSVGRRMWNRFISRYENIFLVLCGHTIPQEGVFHDVVYGQQGNKVNVVLVNHQYFENGGMGNVLTMRFRNNGDIECHTYCPTYDKYLNSAFILREDDRFPDPLHGVQPDQIPGNVSVGSAQHDFSNVSEGDSSWEKSFYALKNSRLTAEGLQSEGTAFVIDRLTAGEGKVFTGLILEAEGKLDSVQIYVSGDGQAWSIVKSFERTESGSFDLTDLILGKKELFVKTVFSGESCLEALRLSGTTVQIRPEADSTGLFIRKEFSGLADYDTTSWSEEAVRCEDLLVFGGKLGTGKQSNYAGAEGWILYRFSAPENACFENLTFAAAGRLTGTDMGFALRLYVAGEDGNQILAVEEKVTQNDYQKSYDLTSYVQGEREITLRLVLYGNYWTSVGLDSYSITGDYRYALTYETGGTQNASENPDSYVFGDETPLLPPQTKENCLFAGWYDHADFTGEPLFSLEGLSGARTLWAKWEPKTYRISYQLNGGINSEGNPAYGLATEETVLEAPSRTGYSFAGWYADPGFSGEPLSALPVGQDQPVMLYARWLKNSYITYILNGGDNAAENPSVYREGEGLTLAAPSREGYAFGGWYLNADFSGEAVTGLDPQMTGAVTLYAKWQAEQGCNGSAAAFFPMLCCAAWALSRRR